MPLPKLSPLQSRLAASLIASLMLFLFYILFSFPHFAYATEVDSIRPEDHNHERLLDRPFLETDYEELELRHDTYEAEFLGLDRGIIGRATAVPTGLENNRMDLRNVEMGETISYVFTNASLWGAYSPSTPGLPSQFSLLNVTLEDALRTAAEQEQTLTLQSRQTSTGANRTLYITVTACDQPKPVSDTTSDPAPQLQLYVSQSASNTNPGPTSNSALQDMVPLVGGFALYQVNATGDVYIGVYGVNNTAYSGVWSAQVAASIDAPYHYYWNSSDPNLFLVDTDNKAALFYTNPFITNSTNTTLYDEWMDSTPPFVMFANEASNNAAITGLQNSYCGLQNHAQILQSEPGMTTSQMVTGMTSIGDGNLPKQQFYMNALSPSTTYSMMLGMNGNSTSTGTGVVGGGGQVFHMTNFTTLSDGNCQVIYDLAFCDQVAYAVPANSNTYNLTSLAAFYDNSTLNSYGIFQKVLAQIPCDTTSSSKYSLARGCDDCDQDYKQWLCSVTIPRCTDFSSTLPWLQPRALGQPFLNGTFLPDAELQAANNSMPTNGSRNALIDQYIIPGPYKEVLPCEDLCYALVQSCPSSMGFSCPRPNYLGFNTSYGSMPVEGKDSLGRITNITCNYPGAAYTLAAGGRIGPSSVLGLILGAVSGYLLC